MNMRDNLLFSLLVINSWQSRRMISDIKRNAPGIDYNPYLKYVEKVACSNRKLSNLENSEFIPLLDALNKCVSKSKNINTIVKDKLLEKISKLIIDYDLVIKNEDYTKAKYMFDEVKHILYTINKVPRRIRYLKYIDKLSIQHYAKTVTNSELKILRKFVRVTMPWPHHQCPKYSEFGFIDRSQYTPELHERIEGLAALKLIEKSGISLPGLLAYHSMIRQ